MGVEEWCLDSVMTGNQGDLDGPPRGPRSPISSGIGPRLEQIAAFFVVTWVSE